MATQQGCGTDELPTLRPVLETDFPALSTTPPAIEPADATPFWTAREMKLSLGAISVLLIYTSDIEGVCRLVQLIQEIQRNMLRQWTVKTS